MKVTRRSPRTGVINTMELDITETQMQVYAMGALIQDAFPNLTPSERVFWLTGYTQEDWDILFPHEEEENEIDYSERSQPAQEKGEGEVMKVELFFVLNGLLDGERDVRALTCGIEEQMPDGWYWSLEGMDNGDGPYTSRDDAKDAGTQDLERYREVARGGIEKHLDDVCTGDDSADHIYEEAYIIALDALIDNPLSKSCSLETARLVAQEQAEEVIGCSVIRGSDG